MKVAVIDGQGGGLGKFIIEKIRKTLGNDVEILALGTNAYATANMVKAGASEGASGESAICYCCKNVKLNCIIGPIGIVCPNSMLGELTPNMAEAIFSAECTKYLIPLNKHGLYIPGVSNLQFNDFMDDIIKNIKDSIT
ncbi:hypothetical protein Q428_04885 [Fervidicella metallireducens AeB]|uniref:DUF3842 domain-containing protein n=1 Tax=Fervidicella metallireducens AeB TaxID=1403537 RepID=A0A017RWD2_9CLOT|nr:DUF3842 family protein [Fervidicella metallireducens]EYE88982.1 hypothetical protein Q428_04885 [Fervidicella metallireducens AeB]